MTKEKDLIVTNTVFCAALVLVEAVQGLIVLVLIFSFIPMPASPALSHLFSRQLAEVFPKRDMMFYHVFVVAIITGQIALLAAWRKQFGFVRLSLRWGNFLLVETGWLLLMLFAVFKFFVYGYPAWAKHMLYAVIVLSILSKIFWKELQELGPEVVGWLAKPKAAFWGTVFFPMFLAALIFVPDLHGVVARMWIGDGLTHMDSSLVGQGWAYLKGTALNVDIYAPYGVGMTAFISLLAKILGGYTYERIVGIVIGSTIVYFILCFFFLRAWLGSVLLAMAGVLLAVKWQMFHQGVYPFVFNYPYSTVVRYWFDMAVFFLLLAHLRRGGFYWLAAAAVVVGLALFHITDTGIYLAVAYVFYVVWWAMDKKLFGEGDVWKDIGRPVLLCLALVIGSAMGWFYFFVGRNVWSAVFWKHMLERADYFFIGHGNLPMYKSLVEGDYSSSLMGFIIPLVYGGVFIAVVGLWFFKAIRRDDVLAAVLCVYGMGLYHYYVLRSGNTSYDVVCIPFVLVLCWLAHQWLGRLSPAGRAKTLAGLFLASAFALLTTHAFLSYPDIFNFSKNPIIAPSVPWPNKNLPFYFNNTPLRYPESFKLPVNSLGTKNEDLKTERDFAGDHQFKAFFDRKFDFQEDAALIDRLTSPQDAVPLMSSFETEILMQADRKPFFYYFPFMLSRPMDMRMFSFSILWTTDQLETTLKQIQEQKPKYVFMEKIMLGHQVPQTYLYLFPEELYILNFLDRSYEPYQYGKYLVAMKRKTAS